MSHEPADLDEEQLAAWLADRDDALAVGLDSYSSADPAPSNQRIARDLQCIRVLRKVWQKPDTIAGQSTTATDRPPAVALQTIPTCIGRFQIRRELGSGACGVVFLAHDPQLRRDVALKVPQLASLASAELRERFRHEALAAAGLDHPNIIPVFEAGEVGLICYIASAFCPGVTLAEWLRGRAEALPGRDAARLIASIADGVQHAHSRGVLHRDLKPSNVLLQRVEGQGSRIEGQKRIDGQASNSEGRNDALPLDARPSFLVPKITDFGLAKLLETGDGSLTQTGSVLGTPFYMAPEQAAGRTKDISTATDVYALGAILYELLTGRPPFQAKSSLEVLRKVESEAPIAPRSVRTGIPRDVATICLKCLEKEPGRRYATAAALAEDLRRFVACRPIQARPISTAEHVWRWASRQPALAGLSCALAVALVTGLAAVGWHWHEAKVQRDQAQLERIAAEAARTRAETNFQTALSAVDRMLTRVGQQQLADVPEMEEIRRDILEDALQFCRQFLDERTEDPHVRQETGRAYARTGAIYVLLGQLDEAEHAWRSAAELQQSLVASSPESPQLRMDLAASHSGLAALLRDTGQSGEAIESFLQALSIREALFDRDRSDPAYRHLLAKTCNELGSLYALTKQPQQAEELIERAIDLEGQLIREQPFNEDCLSGLASSHNSMGSFVLNVLGLGTDNRNVPRIEAAYLSALPIREELAKRFPANVGYQIELARVHKNIGTVYSVTDRRPEAEPYLRKALELRAKIADEHPKVTSYQKAKAKSVYDLAFMLQGAGRADEALPVYQEAIALQEEFVATHPTVIEHAVDLGDTYHHTGRLYFLQGELSAAGPWLEKAASTLEGVLEKEPQHVNARRFLGETYMTLAGVYTGLDRPTDALPTLSRAIEVFVAWRDEFLLFRARTHVRLGDHRSAADDLATILKEYSIHPPICVKAAKFSVQCAEAVRRNQTLPPADASALAERYTNIAREILAPLFAAGGSIADEIANDPEFALVIPRRE